MLLIICFILILILIFYLCNATYENFEKVKKYNLCIMAIFKNEENYLEEWLTHHINQGISHFYLFSNDEKMYNYPYLDSYKDYITLINWTDKKNNGEETIQRQAYNYCTLNYSKECNYLMMLDIDEFCVPLNQNKVIDVINSLDKNTKAIKVQRYDFGNNGHNTKPIGSVKDNYTKHEKICSSYKTIANTNYIDTTKKFYGVHDFPFLNKEGKVYNEYFDYKYKGYPNSCNITDKNEIPLVINHYYTKSYEEYLNRCKLWETGGVNNVGYRKNCENLFKERNKNEVDYY
jgi:hypothetical protein